MNWMTIEFNLLYRWHSLVPEHYLMRQAPGSPIPLVNIPVRRNMFNNRLLTDRGLGAVLEDASLQTAGEIGLLNTSERLLSIELGGLHLGRFARLQGYNAYRQLTGRGLRVISTRFPVTIRYAVGSKKFTGLWTGSSFTPASSLNPLYPTRRSHR